MYNRNITVSTQDSGKQIQLIPPIGATDDEVNCPITYELRKEGEDTPYVGTFLSWTNDGEVTFNSNAVFEERAYVHLRAGLEENFSTFLDS